MKVLVTGGAGYIGSHVARELVRRGHRVVLYDNLCTGHRNLAAGFELIVGDIRDSEKLAPILRDVDAVMHFAAFIEVGESVAHPQKYFENNARGSLSLLNSVLDAGVRRFIYSSTAAVYGVPTDVPISETAPRQPVNPYGHSKLFVENVLEACGVAHDLNFVSLRYFNAAGADESGEIGEMHEPETHLIPSILLAAAGLRPEIQIFGQDYPTPDGTCVRDFIHVNDLAAAHVLALDYLAAGGKSCALNLGTGKGHSVREVLRTAEAVTGCKLPKRFLPRRPGDPPVLVADSSRARQVLEWVPTRSLEDIVFTAWNWIQRSRQRLGEQSQFPLASFFPRPDVPAGEKPGGSGELSKSELR